jgi:DNA-3-methyladenine glycosylase II
MGESRLRTVKTKYFEYRQEEIDYLKSVDETLGAAMTRIGRVERVIIPDLFTALVYAIVGQLISVKAVHTIWERMQDKFGEISPQNMAMQTADDIQSCGMTMKKAVCIRTIAGTIAQGAFNLDELHDLSDTEVIKKLLTLNGVGRWTAEMMLINSMERRDVVSWGDIAIRRGMMKLYGLNTITKEQFEHYRLRYSPLGSVASIYLWNISFE